MDQAKLEAFMGKVVGDLGAALSAPLVVLGDRLGLYKAMAGAGPLSPAELARKTGTVERYVGEWLLAQATSGYVDYDPKTGKYALSEENAAALADEDSPFCVLGGFQVVQAMGAARPRIEDHFKKGGGMLWGEHDPTLFEGTERFFRASYIGHLVGEWLPSLEGVTSKLTSGGKVADVGCGHGASTTIMAKAFPKSRFWGFDNHEPSIERARAAAKREGVSERVTFETAGAQEFPGDGYDLIAFFDCLHDMGDPLSALKRARRAIAPGGSVMIVEPMAGARLEDNLNPVGRVFAAASTLCCTSNAIASKADGPALGTVATDDTFRRLAAEAGFPVFRRATETPFNRVFEARA